MKALVLIVFLLFVPVAQCEIFFPRNQPLIVSFQNVGYCANVNTGRTAINSCLKYQGKAYLRIVAVEQFFSNKVPNWGDIVNKCWFYSLQPNYRSMEKLLRCLKAEIERALTG